MRIIRNKKNFLVTDFQIVQKHKYKILSRNDESVRTYNVLKKKVPSVTTILQATQSAEKKESLRKWRDRVGEEEATRITRQAALRGTEMHFVLEQYLNGIGYLNLSKEGALPRMMAHTIIDNLDQFSQVWGTEVTLHYKDLFAGSCDLVGLFENKPTILDFKQSNKPKKEEWIEDYFLQLSAYIIAHEYLYEKIKKGVVLICTKNLTFQKFSIEGSRLEKYKDIWLKRVDRFHNLPNPLGETIGT